MSARGPADLKCVTKALATPDWLTYPVLSKYILNTITILAKDFIIIIELKNGASLEKAKAVADKFISYLKMIIIKRTGDTL